MSFPYKPEIEINSRLKVHYQDVLKEIYPLLTPERRQKIEKVSRERNFSNAVVLEGIYDRGNISAVMRSAEGMGFAHFHIIETGEKFKEANRVTQGADKWVETKKWKSTRDCIQHLKDQGHRIIVTSLEASKPIDQIDFHQKTAFVLGNEKSGVSDEMLRLSDERVILPMTGFVQSYNISVAGALGLYHIFHERNQAKKKSLLPEFDLNETEMDILKALYALRTLDSAASILENKFGKINT